MPKMRSHHIAIRTPQYEAMHAFYTQTLGFPEVGHIPGRQVSFIDIGGTTIELVGGQGEAQQPACGVTHLAFQVDDVDAACEELKALGISFHIGPLTAGEMHIAFFKDPDGNALELFHSPAYQWYA